MVNSTTNFELNDVQFKQYLTNEWLKNKQRFSEGASTEELLTYTQPTEGDLECLIEYMIDDLNGDEHTQLFDLRLNQALRLFGYSK